MTLKTLRALLAEATPGPWRRGGIDDDCVLADALQTDKAEGHVVCYAYKRSNSDADADAIVAMRNSFEALLDVAEAAHQHITSTNQYPHSEEWIALSEALAKLKASK